jgi:hypothetical protein
MEHLHLFTKISEAEIIEGKLYQVIYKYKGKEFEGIAQKQSWMGHSAWIITNQTFIGDQPEVTHVLDLSKLTTKERAVEVFENMIYEGDCIYTCPSADVAPIEGFSEKMKSKL